MVDFLRATFGHAKVISGQSNSHKSDIGLAYSLRYADGSVASVTLSATQARSSTNERVTVIGTSGWAEVVNLNSVNYRLKGQHAAVVESWHSQLDLADICISDNLDENALALSLCEQGFYGELSHFLRCIADGRAPTPSAEDNVETMVLCDEMIRSVR